MTPELFLLLAGALFVAAAAGWASARRRERVPRHPASSLPAQYFEGLNFLINEEPDRALEVFLRLVELDNDTVELHFALGSLYRRRGEVDRSIRVHENIMARPALKSEHREHGMFALGEDYFRAGLYDRAEQLFERLADGSSRKLGALRYLLRIYEQQGEWQQAIATHERLRDLVSPESPTAIAHYHCELAEAARQRGDLPAARGLLRKARGEQRNFPRGALIRAGIALDEGDPGLAVRLCRRLAELHPQLMPLALPVFVRALHETRDERMTAAFSAWIAANPAGRAGLAHAAIAAGLDREPFVSECIGDLIRTDPVLGELVRALAGDPHALDDTARQALASALGRIFRRTQRYRCIECGLASATHFWQCPGCRSWDGLTPISHLELLPRSRAAQDV